MIRRRTLCRILILVLIAAAVCGMKAAVKFTNAPYNLDLTFKQKFPEIQSINRKRESLLDCLKDLLVQIDSWIGLVYMAERKKYPLLATFLTLDGTEVFTMDSSQEHWMGRMEVC